jgi:hypothetical protein
LITLADYTIAIVRVLHHVEKTRRDVRSTPDLPIMSMSFAIPGDVVPKQRSLENLFVMHSGPGTLPSLRMPAIPS